MTTNKTEMIEGEIVAVENTALTAQRSEHEMKVTTAKKWPRSVKVFKNQTRELATLDEETAGQCFYVLPRGDKTIEGPSVRMAEIVAASWGNLSYGARIVDEDDKWITAQGICYDYEKNISASIEVRRRITDKHGRRFNDDMVQVTGRAACSIALREAIFKVVPRAFWSDILDEAKAASVGKGLTMEKQRDKCMEYWRKAGATDAMVLGFLDRKGIEDITLDDLVMLRGLATAMKDEGIGADRVLSRKETESAKPVGKVVAREVAE